MVNFSIEEKTVAENISGVTLKNIIYEFLSKNKTNKYIFLKELEAFLEEEPIRRIVYNNNFIEYCIDTFEEKDNLKEIDKFSKILKKANLWKNEEFIEIMKMTKNKYGYDFGYIQDQIWYQLYQKYL